MGNVIVPAFDITNVSKSNAPLSVALFDTIAIFNRRTDQIDFSGFDCLVTLGRQGPDVPVTVSYFDLLLVCKGLTDDPKVRAWVFTLDGHDYYVLSLGSQETLVYDIATEQWYTWANESSQRWRAYTGRNWLGGSVYADRYGSNIIAGDAGNGTLYFLDPEGNADDDAVRGFTTPRPFLRQITGQVAVRGYESLPCYDVSLMGSIGDSLDASLTSVTLFTSDDAGKTYQDQGTLTVTPSDYEARLEWNSGLGSFEAPGRMFLVQDFGALKRIDWLETNRMQQSG